MNRNTAQAIEANYNHQAAADRLAQPAPPTEPFEGFGFEGHPPVPYGSFARSLKTGAPDLEICSVFQLGVEG